MKTIVVFFSVLVLGPFAHGLFLNTPRKTPTTDSLDQGSYTCIPWIFNPGCYFNKFINWDLVCRTNTLGWEQCDVLNAQKLSSIGKSEDSEVDETLTNKLTEKESYDTIDSSPSFDIEDFFSSDDASNVDSDTRMTNDDLLDSISIQDGTPYKSNYHDLDLTNDEVDSVSPDVVVHIEDIVSTADRFNTDGENYHNPDMNTDKDESFEAGKDLESIPSSENEPENNKDSQIGIDSLDDPVEEVQSASNDQIEETASTVDEAKVKSEDQEDVDSVSPDVVQHIEEFGDDKSDNFNGLDSVSSDHIDVKGLQEADDVEFKRGYYLTDLKDNMQDTPELDMDQEDLFEFDA